MIDSGARSSKAVEIGVEQSMRAGQSIEMLSGSVRESSQAASVIDASTNQQLTGVEQISSAMVSINQAMQQNLWLTITFKP